MTTAVASILSITLSHIQIRPKYKIILLTRISLKIPYVICRSVKSETKPDSVKTDFQISSIGKKRAEMQKIIILGLIYESVQAML